MSSEVRLSDVVLLHDGELAKLKKALPVMRARLETELSRKATTEAEGHAAKLSADLDAKHAASTEEIKRELSERAGEVAKQYADKLSADIAKDRSVMIEGATALAKAEIGGQSSLLRSEFAKLTSGTTNDILAQQDKKFSEIPLLVDRVANEAANRATKELEKSQTALIHKELSSIAPVGEQLVNANKGQWSTEKVYQRGDIIAFRGSSYLVLRETKRGEYPTQANQRDKVPTYQILAAAGSPGPRGTGEGGSSLPSMSGQSGKYLTNNGTIANWAALAGGGDVVASGTLTLNALLIGGGGTTAAATATGTGVLTALAVNVGSAGAFITFNGDAGTPSALVGTNITGTASGLTAGVASAVAVGGITGLGTGVATFLATPSSANLASAVTDETGSGLLVFGTSPTITTPTLSGVITAAGSVISAPATITLTSNAGTLDITKAYSAVTITANSTLTPSAAGSNGQTCAVYVTNGQAGSLTLTMDNSGTDYVKVIPAGTSMWVSYVSNGTDLVLTQGDPASASVASTSRIQLQNPSSGVYFYDVVSALGAQLSGIPISGIASLGTGVATALAVNVGSAGAFVTFNGALGTPSSGTLTNCTFPTLNQNTTGSAASLSISGQTGLVTLTGITSTNRIKTVRDAADTILELGGSYTPTGTWTSLTMVTPVLGTPTSGTLTNCTADGTNLIGYRGAPQNSQSAAYTTVLADAGKCIFHPSSDNNARTFTIDSNANVAYPIGTIIEFINMAATASTIAITSDTLTLLPAGTTGSRTLAQYGRASVEKISSTAWVISGNSALT